MTRLAAILCLLASPCIAEEQCGPRSEVLRALKDRYGELNIFAGMMGNDAALEIVGAVNGTWTALVSRPDGTSCIIAAGEPWIATGVPQGEAG